MPSRDIKDCHPRLQKAYEHAAKKFNSAHKTTQVFLTCTYRSNEEQAALYAQGRTTAGKIVTNAKAGTSKHNKKPSEAFDIAFRDLATKKLNWSLSLFKEFYGYAKEVEPNLRWGANVKNGGSFRTMNDAPHYEI